MQRVASELVREVRIGVSPDSVSIRVDGPALLKALRAGDLGLALLVGGGSPQRVVLSPDQAKVAFGSIAEIVLDRAGLSGSANGRLSLSLLVTDARGNVVEQHPSGAAIEIELPGDDLDAVNWTI
jgi:hypothetical protein